MNLFFNISVKYAQEGGGVSNQSCRFTHVNDDDSTHKKTHKLIK